MKKSSHSYLSPKLEAIPRLEKGGYGVYARQSIKKGELLTVWGGKVTESEKFSRLAEHTQRRSIQVEEELYLVPLILEEPADFVNHCCDPNAGMSGQIALVAIRDIQPGEEICYDYAMSDGSHYDEFECNCGAPSWRRRVTGDDWRDPEMQQKYAGYFSPYLQRRIDQLKLE